MINLYTKNKQILQIDENLEIQRGGEGAIYKLGNDKVVKLYHQGINGISETAFQYLKVLPVSIFVIPEELLYNSANELVGFSMEFIPSDFLPLSNLFGQNFCIKHHLTFDFKLQIAKKLIEALKIAHTHQIIIGDFNQFNILFSLSGEVKFIDTDSYQTPALPHSGRLLDEIRDYLYQGIVSKNSDYFALSVLVFYLLTFAHPFKGISKTVKKMQDRMIMKLPIFAKDIIQPKVYQAIPSADLQLNFERFYLNGERFLLDFDSKIQVQAQAVQKVQIISNQTLIIQHILAKTDLLDVEFNKTRGCAETKDNFILFDASDKGQLIDLLSVKKTEFDEIFLSAQAIFARKANKLIKLEKNGSHSQISNFEFPTNFRKVQYGDSLLIVADNLMFELSLGEIFNSSVKIKRTEIYSETISNIPKYAQNVGGNYRLFYQTGTNLANLQIPIIPKLVEQIEQVGMIQYIENNQIKNNYFLCNGLKFELCKSVELSEFKHFAFQSVDNTHGFIYEPSDDEIILRRTQNFEAFASLKTEVVSDSSKLFHTLSGIICFTDGKLYLLNKK